MSIRYVITLISTLLVAVTGSELICLGQVLPFERYETFMRLPAQLPANNTTSNQGLIWRRIDDQWVATTASYSASGSAVDPATSVDYANVSYQGNTFVQVQRGRAKAVASASIVESTPGDYYGSCCNVSYPGATADAKLIYDNLIVTTSGSPPYPSTVQADIKLYFSGSVESAMSGYGYTSNPTLYFGAKARAIYSIYADTVGTNRNVYGEVRRGLPQQIATPVVYGDQFGFQTVTLPVPTNTPFRLSLTAQALSYEFWPWGVGSPGGESAASRAVASISIVGPNWMSLPPGWGLHYYSPGQPLDQTPNDFQFLPGDYNRDGTVDQDDYLLWRQNFGSTSLLDADGNDSGTVDAADYVVWRKHLPTPASGSTPIEGSPIPEPSTIFQLGIGAISLLGRRKAKSHG